MERLTERDKDGWIMSSADSQKIREKLAYYEDAEEQGRLIEFPVAIGDYVWVIQTDFMVKTLNRFTVTSLCVDGSTRNMLAGVFVGDQFNGDVLNLSEIGKTVFTSYEQAEATLKELEAEADVD